MSERLNQHSNLADTALWSPAAQGLAHNFAGEVCIQAIRLTGLVVLTRILLPAEFGIFRILLVICAFASLTNFAGIADALIQREDLRSDHISTGWFVTSLLGLSFGLALYRGAPLISDWMKMPELKGAARLLCLPIVLDSTAGVGNATLRRALRFGALALADVLSEAGGLLVSLLLIAIKKPEMALPGGLAARMTLRASAVWIAAGHPFRGAPSLKAAGEIVRFSTFVLSGQVLLICSSNADYFLVGRMLGKNILGYYSIAWDLLLFIPNRLDRIVVRVAMSLFCRIQDDNERLTDTYCRLLSYCSRIMLPCLGCAAVVAPQLIIGIYGLKWQPVVAPLQFLTLGLASTVLRLGVGTLYYAKNRPDLDIWLHAVRLTLVVAVVLLTVRFGLDAVCIGMSVEEVVITVLCQVFVCALIDLRVSDLLAALRPGLQLAVACALTSLLGVGLTTALHLELWSTLVLIILTTGLVFFAAQLSLAKKLYRTFLSGRLSISANISN